MLNGAETGERVVVLDDDDRIAARPELLERAEQLLVVARVQADGRLVEQVEYASESGADLRGEADALGLASRELTKAPVT